MATRSQRSRKRVGVDVNRICSWVETYDRDGDRTYYGLNYRGQWLVHAILEKRVASQSGQSYLIHERLYNVDGEILQERRPIREGQSWSVSKGYTIYTYDEPAVGEDGVAEERPGFWGRRRNLLQVEEYAGVDGASSMIEPTGATIVHVGTYRRFAYDPFFNELISIEEGLIEQAPSVEYTPGESLKVVSPGVFHPQMEERRYLDYQQLSFAGFRDSRLGRGVMEWRLLSGDSAPAGIEFLDRSLNNDGQSMYIGRPVQVSRGSSSDDVWLSILYSWAPGGNSAWVKMPDGSSIDYFYYGSQRDGRLDQYWGAPGDSTSQRWSGLLARVETRTLGTYPSVGGVIPLVADPALPGPYQWLSGGEGLSGLADYGLPPEVLGHISSASSQPGGSADFVDVSRLRYSELGLPTTLTRARSQHGFKRDVDGRVVRWEQAPAVEGVVSGPPSVIGKRAYDDWNNLLSEIVESASGSRLSATFWAHDGEGNAVFECEELEPGACGQGRGLQDVARSWEASTHTFRYSPEGRLIGETDPEGLEIAYERNARKLVTKIIEGAQEPRITELDYSDDGDLISRHRKGATGSGYLQETLDYDGLRRAVSFKDSRGTLWKRTYAGTGHIAGLRATQNAQILLDTSYRFDPLGRVREASLNGLVTTIARSLTGNVIRTEAPDGGYTLQALDAIGRPLWQWTPDGSHHAYVWNERQGIVSHSVVSPDGGGGYSSITTTQTLDLNDLAVGERVEGGGLARERSFVRSPLGFVERTYDPASDGMVEYQRNLVGWPKVLSKGALSDELDRLEFEDTYYSYDRRGAVEYVHAHGSQDSYFSYNEFGEINYRAMALHWSDPGETISYDFAGRVREREVSQQSRVSFVYSQQSGEHPHGIYVASGGYQQLHRSYQYDGLGRVTEAWNYNNGVGGYPQPNSAVRSVVAYDNPDGSVSTIRTQVGPGNAERTWTSTLSLQDATPFNPADPGAGIGWSRTVSFSGGGDSWTEYFDHAGRLSLRSGGLAGDIDFSWNGDRYAGRRHDAGGAAAPLSQIIETDEFWRPKRMQYRALDVEDGFPVDAQHGTAYCGGTWSTTACSKPLYEVSTGRDLAGQVISVSQRFSHPLRYPGGSLFPDTTHMDRWDGYIYSSFGRLDREWSYANPGGTPPDVGTHLNIGMARPAATLATDTLGDLVGASLATYERESPGSLVLKDGGPTSWEGGSRDYGYRFFSVSVDAGTLSVEYDLEGNVSLLGDRELVFDQLGILSAVHQYGNTERYLYDAFGRLVGVSEDPYGYSTERIFDYDGLQMAAEWSEGSQAFLWHAQWGPGIDNLIGYSVPWVSDRLFPIVDHRNSVVAFWDPDQQQLSDIATYTAEGQVILLDSMESELCREDGVNPCVHPVESPFGFVSAWRSDTTGFIWMRNRWYSPTLGEFLSHDPLGFIDSYNPYAYASFDPISFWDPMGLGTRDLAEERGPVGGFFDSVANRLKKVSDTYEDLKDKLVDKAGELGRKATDKVQGILPRYDRPGQGVTDEIAEDLEQKREEGLDTGERGAQKAAELAIEAGELAAGALAPVGKGGKAAKEAGNVAKRSGIGKIFDAIGSWFRGEKAAGDTARGLSTLGRAGRGSGVREVVGDSRDARKLFDQLRGSNPATEVKPGVFTARATDGGTVTFRATSKSGPPTVDVHGIEEGVRKIKFVEH